MGRHVGDLSLEQLKKYKPELIHKPKDFESFWRTIKKELAEFQPKVTLQYRDYPVPNVEVTDILFNTWDGTPLNGVLVKPKGVKECPVIVSYPGYTGDHGLPIDYLKWTSLGIAVYAFDVRGQGISPDYAEYKNGTRIPGWMLHGIKEPKKYYYTNVYKDSLLQLNWIKENAPFAITALGLIGSSQGGGLALAVGGLDGRQDFIVADYPFNTHFERSLEVALTGPYMEIVNYFKIQDPQYETYDVVLLTLSYVDSLYFCADIDCPVLMSIGLEDSTTPPSSAFAAFNYLSSEDKQIEVYPNYKHEINSFHEEKKLAFVMRQLNLLK